MDRPVQWEQVGATSPPMKFLSFPTTLAAAIVCGGVVAACTAPPIGDTSSGSAVTGNDGSSGSAKKSTKTPATNPTATIPLGDDDDDNGPPPSGGKGPVACMTKCIGSDAAANTIYTAYATCESKCQKGDSACDDKCNGDVNTACDAQPDACQTVDGCSSKCAGGKGGSSSGGSSSGGGGGGGLTFADVQSLIANDCSSCHHHQGQFGTLADVQASQQDFLDRIQSGSMPPSDANFAQSDDGQKILSWLQNGTDLQ
jgi:hypothetical protein